MIAAALAAAPAAPAQSGGAPAPIVLVRGTVFDSLTRTPLERAHVEFVRAAAPGGPVVAATTTADGAFEVSLGSGAWLASIEHPRFDSLGVSVLDQPVDVPQGATFTVALATPSPATVTRALCGPAERTGDVALVGAVRSAATLRLLDSVTVQVHWQDLTLRRGGFTRTLASRSARTDRDGRYLVCGVPAGGTVLAWAEREGGATGAIAFTFTQAPGRLDFSLDLAGQPAPAVGGIFRDSLDPRLLAAPAGTARYRAIVRDLSGQPVPLARARILGHRFVSADERGTVTIDSVPGGSQTLEVQALGYVPERRVVEISTGALRADTVFIASLKSVLDTIRVTAGRDEAGFDARRRGKLGQFITAADIERENPRSTTALLKSRDGLRLVFDRAGIPSIVSNTGPRPCAPLLLVDGFRPKPVVRVTGRAALDWIVLPEEIGGVEIYNNPAEIPAKMANWPDAAGQVRLCGAIVIWTREKLGLPRATRTDAPPGSSAPPAS